MNQIIFLALLFVATSGYGIDQTMVVKVGSGLCTGNRNVLRGSGLGFNFKSKSYVLTSEHVVLHGNGDFCHQVRNSDIGVANAILKIAEYGNGLALLELTKFVASWNSWDDLQPLQAVTGMEIQVLGFPYEQEELIALNHGNVLTAASPRNFLPQLNCMIETVNAHGEFGMSGGPVVAADNRFIGLLSHQYLSLTPGRRTLMALFSEKSQIENHLLIIPGDAIAKWLNLIFRSLDAALPFAVRDPKEQLAGRDVVLAMGLRFTFKDDKVVQARQQSGGGGVGGADGAGAGGTDQVSQASASFVEIELDETKSRTLPCTKFREDWCLRLRQRLMLSGNRVHLPFFVDRTSDDLTAIRAESMADFFRLLNRSDLEPVNLIQDTSLTSNLHCTSERNVETNDQIQILRNHGVRLNEILSTISSDDQTTQTSTLLHNVALVSSLISSDSWTLLNKKHLHKISDVAANKDAWKPLFIEKFELTVELLEILKRLEAVLDKIKI